MDLLSLVILGLMAICPPAARVRATGGRCRAKIKHRREAGARGLAASALVLAGLLGGCATPAVEPQMIPAPVIFKDARYDLFAAYPPDARTTGLSVLYATTRQPAASGAPSYFTAKPGDGVQLGIATVRLGAPTWDWEQLIQSDRGSVSGTPRPARVERIEGFGRIDGADYESAAERAWVAAINRQLARDENKQVIVYVHGYRVTFEDVLGVAGSFAHYLGSAGAIVTFQWPTDLHFWNYLTDCPRARQYIPQLQHLIELLARKTTATRINLIAYSCGSPVLAEALSGLRQTYAQDGADELARRLRIGNVTFAASDIDLKHFARAHLEPILELSTKTIVYVSRNDMALNVSSILSGVSRLGAPKGDEIDPKEAIRLRNLPQIDRLEFVNVTRVPGAQEMGGMAGHGYWYGNDWVSTDILIAMRYQLPAERRGLVPHPRYTAWEFPVDYPDRLGAAIRRLLPGRSGRDRGPDDPPAAPSR